MTASFDAGLPQALVAAGRYSVRSGSTTPRACAARPHGRTLPRNSRCGSSHWRPPATITPATTDEASLGRAERLQLDYRQTTDLIRELGDVRFKLLALVPTASGAAVGLIGDPHAAVELLAIGVLGLVATLGILLYELRNSQLADYARERARQLEGALELGLFRDEPERALHLFGIVTLDRDGGLALVYAAALGGWTYLVAWGALRAAHAGNAREIGAAIGAGAGALVLVELLRLRRRA